MPEPGSKKYDNRRKEYRGEAEAEGIPDKHANREAKKRIEEDPQWRPEGPRTERGRGPKGERESND